MKPLHALNGPAAWSRITNRLTGHILPALLLTILAIQPLYAADPAPAPAAAEKKLPPQEDETAAQPTTARSFTEQVRDALTEAVLYIRNKARHDEQHFFVPPIRQRLIVDHKMVKRRYTEKIIKRPIYEYETYKTVAASHGGQSIAGPSSLRKVTRRRIKRIKEWKEEKRLIPDRNGAIVRKVSVPVYGPGGPDRLFNGFYGQNAMAIYALTQCGVPLDEPLMSQACQTVANCLDGYGLPDKTWDLAWLTIAFVNLPQDVKLYKTTSEQLVNKLLIGQLSKGPAAGMWANECINPDLLAKMITYEQKAYQKEVGTWAKKLREKKGNKRYKERLEEGKKAIGRFHEQYKRFAQQGVTFEYWAHYLDIEPSQEFMQRMAWAFGKARVDRLPYFIYGEMVGDASTSALVLTALNEAAKNGYLPEFSHPAEDIDGRPLISPVKSTAVLERGAAAIAQHQRRKGISEARFWLPLHTFDEIGLPGLPIKKDRIIPLKSATNAMSTLQGYVGMLMAGSVQRSVRSTYGKKIDRARKLVVKNSQEMLQAKTMKKMAGGHVPPYEYIFFLSRVAASCGDRSLWWNFANNLLEKQNGNGPWVARNKNRPWVYAGSPALREYKEIMADRWYDQRQKKVDKKKRKKLTPAQRRAYGQQRLAYGGLLLAPDMYSTAAAMLFLAEGIRPPIIGTWAWNNKTPRTKNIKYAIRRLGKEKGVSLEITDIGAALDPAETEGIPLLFVRGAGPFKPASPKAMDRLRRYLETGLLIVEVPGTRDGAVFMGSCAKMVRGMITGARAIRLPGRRMPTVQGIADADGNIRAVFIPVKSGGRGGKKILSSSQAKKFMYQLCLKNIDANFLATDYAISWQKVQAKEEQLAADEAKAAARALMGEGKDEKK